MQTSHTSSGETTSSLTLVRIRSLLFVLLISGSYHLHFLMDYLHQMTGFIIPVGELQRAVKLLTEAGLPQCTCKTMHHASDPRLENTVAAHFPVGSSSMFLCTNDMVFDLIPLTPDHPNPLNLVFTTQQIQMVLESASSPAAGIYEAGWHAVSFLDLRSIAVLHLYLARSRKQKEINRRGIGLTWHTILYFIVGYMDLDNQLVLSIQDKQLQADYCRIACLELPSQKTVPLVHRI